jgi:hypothetical protein
MHTREIARTVLGALALLAPFAPSRSADGAETSADARPATHLETTPSDPHARLQSLAGTWEAVLFVRDSQGMEQRSAGRLTATTYSEFHTLDSFQGAFMGMDVVGRGLNGYCPIRKQYYTFWTDSLSATPMTLYGDYDAVQRELVLRGEALGMTGEIEPCRTVTRYPDADHMTWAMFGAGPDGAEIQHLRIEYTRKP